jgi:hypothetical protein
MNINPLHHVIVVSSLCLAASAIAETTYTENFDTVGKVSFSNIGWSVYLPLTAGGVADVSTSGTNVAEVWATNGTSYSSYGYVRLEGSDTYDNSGSFMMFSSTSDSLSAFEAVDISDISALSVDTKLDGSEEDPAVLSFIIQIDGQWYVSDYSFESIDDIGQTGDLVTYSTIDGFDFTDGDNWYELTVEVGETGEITIADTVVGGTLTGTVTAYGLYGEAGADGDHARIDNFSVTVIPEPGTFALLGGVLAFSAVMIRRRK